MFFYKLNVRVNWLALACLFVILPAYLLTVRAAWGAEPPTIGRVQVFPTPLSVRVLISLNQKVVYNVRETSNPSGLVLEIPHALSKASSEPIIGSRDPVRQVTVHPSEGNKPAWVEMIFTSPAKWDITTSEEGRLIAVEIHSTQDNSTGKSTGKPKPLTSTNKPKSLPVKPLGQTSEASLPKLQQTTQSTQAEGILECAFKDTELQDVIQVIAKLAGVNIIADSSVQGKVTLNLSNIAWEEGLSTSLRSLGYVLRKDGAVYIVSKTPVEKAPTINVEGGKLYVSAVGTDIKQLLTTISEKSGLNIVTGPSVDGKISVHLSGVQVEDGIYTFLTANGYTFRKLDDIFVVDKMDSAKSKPAMRPYKDQGKSGKDRVTIDFKDTELSEVLEGLGTQTGKNIVTYGQMPDRITIRLVDISLEEALKLVLAGTKYTYKQIDSVHVVGDATNLSSPVAQMLTSTEIIPLKYIRAVEAPKYLSGVVPSANIKPLSEQNSLLVVGTEDMIARVKDEVKLIDKVCAQVMIEAQIIEVSSNASKTLALELQGQDGTFNGKIPGTGQIVYNSTGALSKNLIATVQALITEGKAKVIANPKVTTINGKEANITISQQRYFRTASVPQNDNGSSSQNAYYYATSQVQSVEAGIMLRIVPFVGASDEITVDIEPEVSNVTGTGPDGLPEISRRKASTTVRVRNGETIVIGGLKQNEESKAISRTPILSDIPIIGQLFRSRTKNARESDLMILITPTLLFSEESTPVQIEEKSK